MNTLKSVCAIALLFFTINFSFAQSTEWKEQTNFHSVMAQTFHPAEEGNFDPIKKRSEELVQKAEAWMKSSIPANVKDKKKIKKTLIILSKETVALDKKVKNLSSNDEIKAALSHLHDTFHTIVGLCNAKDDDHAGH